MRTKRRQTLGLAAGMLVVGTMAGGCTSEPLAPGSATEPRASAKDSEAPTPQPISTFTIKSSTCPDVSGYTVATNGILSLGPFSADALTADRVTGTARKLWAASQREDRVDAVLTVIDPHGVRADQSRPFGVAVVDNAKQFYPGTIDVESSGPYRITLMVGQDQICVSARFKTSGRAPSRNPRATGTV